MGVKNKKEELASALFDEMNTLTFRLAPPAYQAAMLADIVTKLGWQWHPPKVEEPLADWEKELRDGGPWKDLPVVNFSDYEINADGRIRHKETKECVNTEWDKQWQRYCVKLTKSNGDWVKLEGPVVAKELFR